MSRQSKGRTNSRTDSSSLDGFTFQKPEAANGANGTHGANARGAPDASRLGLYLPTQLHMALAQEKLDARAALQKKIADERAADRAAIRAAELKADEQRQLQPARRSPVLDDFARDEALSNLKTLAEREKRSKADSRAWRQVYDAGAVADFLRRAALLGVDKDIRKRDEELAKKLTEAGLYRQIAAPFNGSAKRPDGKVSVASQVGQAGQARQPPGRRSGRVGLKQVRATSDALNGLRLSHPHFSDVIDFVSQHYTLASRSTTALSFPPLLLNGEPGMGKTHFAMALAAVIGTDYRRVAFDTPVTAATLMGSDRRWGNTQVGLLFDLVCLGQYANPVIVLDEMDKASNRRDWNPLEPLHTLLEPGTAAKVRDLSVDFEFDASQVIWIATSNDSRRLSGAIRSRFQEFYIQRPDAAGALASARAVLGKSFAALNLVDFESPGKDMAVAIAHLTPREITQVLRQAVATAIAKGKRTVSPEDLPASVSQDEDSPTSGAGSARSTDKSKTWLH